MLICGFSVHGSEQSKLPRNATTYLKRQYDPNFRSGFQCDAHGNYKLAIDFLKNKFFTIEEAQKVLFFCHFQAKNMNVFRKRFKQFQEANQEIIAMRLDRKLDEEVASLTDDFQRKIKDAEQINNV